MTITDRLERTFSGFVALYAFLALAAGCSSAAESGGTSSRGTMGAAGQRASTNSNAAGDTANPSTTPSSPNMTGLAPMAPTTNGPGNTTPTTCASGMQSASRLTPTIWLVVDGSGSMDDEFDAGRSRWVTLRSTLMDPGGVVDSLQSVARFGMVIYSGNPDDQTTCVQLVTVPPAINNLATLSAQYPQQPLGNGTPTDKALDYVVNNLPISNMGALDQDTGPIYVVLATDGAPNDNCGGRGGGSRGGGANAMVEQNVIDITTRGTKNGMQMFVISLAGSDTRLQDHLAKVADATASKTPPFIPATQNDLVTAFRKIVGGATCQVVLNGKVAQGRECSGRVQLNSSDLKCNDPDGWKLTDPSTVQLTGMACSNFMLNHSLVTANFPCDAFTPQ